MNLHRVAIRLTHLLLAWTVIAVTFALGFIVGQRSNEKTFRPLLSGSSPVKPVTDELDRSGAPVYTLPLEITAINGARLTTQLSAGALPRTYEGPATRSVELVRATKIFRVTFDAVGLPQVREVKSSALRVGQQIVVSSTVDLARLVTIQASEIRILE